MPICSHFVYFHSHGTMAGLSSYDPDYRATKPKVFTIWPHIKDDVKQRRN